jgi:hypothetical protein
MNYIAMGLGYVLIAVFTLGTCYILAIYFWSVFVAALSYAKVAGYFGNRVLTKPRKFPALYTFFACLCRFWAMPVFECRISGWVGNDFYEIFIGGWLPHVSVNGKRI